MTEVPPIANVTVDVPAMSGSQVLEFRGQPLIVPLDRILQREPLGQQPADLLGVSPGKRLGGRGRIAADHEDPLAVADPVVD